MAAGRDFLGSYRLVRLIRAGATCQVWEAVHDSTGNRVAIKALQPEIRTDRVEIAYLRHELEVGHDLDHPNVIQVYDFHTDREIPFLVLELSTARNMKLRLRDGLDQIAYFVPTIIQQAGQGLGYFHEQGWVHRDVKPDNFLVDDKGNVKLIDFALALKQRTGIGRLMPSKVKVQGTRSYMAPEQIRGKAVDARADLYSFGCLVYELLAGKPPFTASTPEELLRKHLYSPAPSVTTVNDNVTSDFNQLILQAMAKSADERPQSLLEFTELAAKTRLFRRFPKNPLSEITEATSTDKESTE
ncbi:MAG: serine/threonine protein kinase [Pirellulaceae bacterium]|nr:serine/threonine protein kinase [Pirellulaceae bacterium]